VASCVSHSAGMEKPSEAGVCSVGAAIIRLCAKIVGLPTMPKKTPHTNRRYREDLSEMPDWLKKKTCPNRDKYLSGKRILPKELTGQGGSWPTWSITRFWRTMPRGLRRGASFSRKRCSNRM